MLAQQKWSSGSLIVLGGLLKLIVRGWLGKLQHGPFKSRSSTVQCQRQVWWHWRVNISYFKCGENGQNFGGPPKSMGKIQKNHFLMFSASGSPNQQLDLHQISLFRYQKIGGLWLSATVAKTKGYIKGVADLVTDYKTVCHILEIWLSPILKISRHLQCQLWSCIATSPYARKVMFF